MFLVATSYPLLLNSHLTGNDKKVGRCSINETAELRIALGMDSIPGIVLCLRPRSLTLPSWSDGKGDRSQGHVNTAYSYFSRDTGGPRNGGPVAEI
jgi:hypothetical protein